MSVLPMAIVLSWIKKRNKKTESKQHLGVGSSGQTDDIIYISIIIILHFTDIVHTFKCPCLLTFDINELTIVAVN